MSLFTNLSHLAGDPLEDCQGTVRAKSTAERTSLLSFDLTLASTAAIQAEVF